MMNGFWWRVAWLLVLAIGLMVFAGVLTAGELSK